MKKTILPFLFILLLGSCKKDNKTECERWEYWEECIKKNANTLCSNTYNLQGNVCGERLEDARAGRTYTRLDNNDVRIVVHYVRKID